MRKIGLSLLFGVFTGLIAYVSAERLYDWYQTGRLAVHKKMPVGPDVTYSSDPVRFLMEFDLNLFLIAMGSLGVLAACREVILEVKGPQSFFDLRRARELLTIFTWLLGGFFLIVLAFGVLQRLA
jgi:hypothetical protein